MGSNIAGIKDILHHDKLLFDPFDVESFSYRIQRIFSHANDFDAVRQLCQERKSKFIFDWQERFYGLSCAFSSKTCCLGKSVT